MELPSSFIASNGTCALVAIGSVLALSLLGALLMPRSLFDGPPLARWAMRLASGIVFAASLSATLSCGRGMYLTIVLVIQVAAVLLSRRQPCTRFEGPRLEGRELLPALLVLVLAVWLYQMPYQFRVADDGVRPSHPDIGFYTGMVLGLPEAKAANGWAALLGEHAVASSGTVDQWYHWGAMYLAVGIRYLTGLPPINALVDVSCMVLNVSLLLTAGAFVGALCPSLRLWKQLALGAVSLLGLQYLQVDSVLQRIVALAGSDYGSHIRFSMALAFPYKYEGVSALAAAVAWLHGRGRVAVMLLFIAAVGAPHVVAAVGVAAGPLMLLGFAMKKRDIWQPSAAIVGTLLGAWATVRLLGGVFPKSEHQAWSAVSLPTLMQSARAAGWDMLLTVTLSALSLPGLIHLLRCADSRLRVLAGMTLCGLFGACVALQLLHHMPDRFHVMTMLQALVVLPVSLWGLMRFTFHSTGTARLAALVLIAASAAMGVQGLLKPLRDDAVADYKMSDLAKISQVLQGRPYGYITADDRAWWLPRNAYLAGLLGSRCVRINPDSADANAHSKFYGSAAPFNLVPVRKGEAASDWCHRFIAALGIKHLLESPDAPLPEPLRVRCKAVASGGGLTLFELPPDIAAGKPLVARQ